MSTLVTLHISDPENAGQSWQIPLADDWDVVFNRVYPVNPPASNLEHRENMWHNHLMGHRVAINPNVIAVIEELTDDHT